MLAEQLGSPFQASVVAGCQDLTCESNQFKQGRWFSSSSFTCDHNARILLTLHNAMPAGKGGDVVPCLSAVSDEVGSKDGAGVGEGVGDSVGLGEGARVDDGRGVGKEVGDSVG